ncbi:Serine/threonine-protein phosphatase 2A regulatory subunit B'' subunit beta [Linnemannia zychae]|nr:Serine/threonine-protein phosphatase 2A regulatory subunit B'' subunit beta [Linnemannia zychae]
MAWSREGTSEELSKYQEFQMRQNDGHHRPQSQQSHSPEMTVLSTPPTNAIDTAQDRGSPLEANSRIGSFSEVARGSQTNQNEAAEDRLHVDYHHYQQSSGRSDQLDPHTELSAMSTHRNTSSERTLDPSNSTPLKTSSSSPSIRQSKSNRIKIKSKGHEDGNQHGLDSSISATATTRSERTPGSPHCQRHRASGASAKKGHCTCSSCQHEGIVHTSSQRSHRYGQYHGSEPIPIYAGPLGLGDDIPSPTPSPPTSGRMGIHMAISGHSPIGSPIHSPILTIAHSTMGKLSPTYHRLPGSKSKSGRHPVIEGFSGSGELQDEYQQQEIMSDSTSDIHHSVATSHQTRDSKIKSKFEAWSLSEQIQDRIVRTSPYKSAVLSPSSNHTKKLSISPQLGSRSRPHLNLQSNSQLQSIQHQPLHQPQDPSPTPSQSHSQPESQPQVLDREPHSSDKANTISKSSSIPAESSPSKRTWQWQWRGQISSSKEISSDRTPRKTIANTIAGRKTGGTTGHGGSVTGMLGSSSSNGSSNNSSPSSGNNGAISKTGNESGGSTVHVLRRTRSAPILASGHLSYADILKASIKATSEPNLSSSASSPSGYISLFSSDSATSHLHIAGSSSPLVTTNTTSVSGTISSFNNSSEGTGYRSRLIAPLTPARTMKPLRRRSLSNIKNDISIISAPLKPLANPLIATEAQQPNQSPSVMEIDEVPTFGHRDGLGIRHDNVEVDMMENSTTDPEDIEMSTTDEAICDLSDYKMEDVTKGALFVSSKSEEEKLSRNTIASNVTTGPPFFEPSEKLDAEECSTDAVRVAQNAVVEKTEDLKSIRDNSKEILDESEDMVSSKSINTLSVSSPASATPDTKTFLTVETDMDSDSFESIVLEIPNPPSTNAVVSVKNDLQGIKQEDIVTMSSMEVEDKIRNQETTNMEAVLTPAVTETVSVIEEPECPFQKQLALQEQVETESKQSKITGGLKSRRKRNDSSGGKRLLLKKKTSLPNLRNSFQQQQMQQQGTSTSESDSATSDSPASATGKASSTEYVIPPFYFPMGKPIAPSKRRQRVHSAVTKAKEIFVVAENGVLSETGFVAITVHCCELPRYMNRALFRKVDISGSNEVRFQEFERVWESLVETCPDEISMIFTILKQPNANVLTPTDFEAVLQDLVLFHPGLEFLSGNAVFQERYLETVITRIFYEANRRHGKLKLSDLRRANFDKTLRKLENSDLNQTEDCFSYKHFYVIYCKFWELDQDHDLILDEQDLAGYSGGAISTRIIRRVMQGYGNETGMFIVPDQELVLQQQQQQQQRQLLLMQQQQLLQQQQQQQQHLLQVLSNGMNVNHSVSTEEYENDDGIAGVDSNMSERITSSDEGSPVPESKTLRRSKTMTLSDINISSDFKDNSMTSSAEERLISPVADNPVPMPIANPIIQQRTTPLGPGVHCRPQNYRMTYKGFIWFLLAETDKQTATSIEYWFRCMDLDGDGLLTVFELEQLFQEQAARMSILSMESFGFRDAICQMQDLVSPKEAGVVRLSDLKQCGQAGPFIDLFCNVLRWRNFEAHQHQIRMRQQQIAMQRATEAAWEEAAVGEDLFEDEDGDDEDDEEEDNDDDNDMEDDEEDETDELSDDYVDGSESPESNLSDETETSSSSNSSTSNQVSFGQDIEMSDSQSLLLVSTGSPCVGLGLGIEHSPKLDNAESNKEGLALTPIYQNSEQYLGGGEHTKNAEELVKVSQQQEGALDETVELNPVVTKTRRRRSKKKFLKQPQSMEQLALLEEQRKEKALLATIRESPWIVYVESEYEKLVTIDRPQSRTGWEQEDEEDEEEDDHEEDEDEEDDLDDAEDGIIAAHGMSGSMSNIAASTVGASAIDDHNRIMMDNRERLDVEEEGAAAAAAARTISTRAPTSTATKSSVATDTARDQGDCTCLGV